MVTVPAPPSYSIRPASSWMMRACSFGVREAQRSSNSANVARISSSPTMPSRSAPTCSRVSWRRHVGLMITDRWRESGGISPDMSRIARDCLDVRASLCPYGATAEVADTRIGGRRSSIHGKDKRCWCA